MEYVFTLRDLRKALNISRYEIAARLSMESHEYFEIEKGIKKPDIDTLRDLAALYGTSMDFVYHAFYHQGVKYSEIEKHLEYALRKNKKQDLLFVGNWHRPPYMPLEEEVS